MSTPSLPPLDKCALPDWLFRSRALRRDSFVFECVATALGLSLSRSSRSLFTVDPGQGGPSLAFYGSITHSTGRVARMLLSDCEMLWARLRSEGLPVPDFRSVFAADWSQASAAAKAVGFPVWINEYGASKRSAQPADLHVEAELRQALSARPFGAWGLAGTATRGRAVISARPRGRAIRFVMMRGEPVPLMVQPVATHRVDGGYDGGIDPGFARLAGAALAAIPGALVAGVDIFSIDFASPPDESAVVNDLTVAPNLLQAKAQWEVAIGATLSILLRELGTPATPDFGPQRRVVTVEGLHRPSAFADAAIAFASQRRQQAVVVAMRADSVELRISAKPHGLALLSMAAMAGRLAAERPDRVSSQLAD